MDQLDAIPRKTERAREALKERAALPHNQRLFLIMVDGRKSLRELAEPAERLGIDRRALAAMAHGGLLQLRKPPAGPPSTISTFGDESLPFAEAEPERTPPRPMPSLAATKLYAIDLMALMLPGQDGALRDAARQLTDADGMRRWLGQASAQIAARASEERASLFMEKVGGMLPSDFFEPEPALAD